MKRKINNIPADKEVLDLVSRLDRSIVLTGAEVIYVNEIYELSSIQHFIHSSYLYTDIVCHTNAVSYSLHDNSLIKEQISVLHLTLDSTHIVQPTQENLAILLIDECQLVRRAASDLYSRVS
jgi:hypothetical protein